METELILVTEKGHSQDSTTEDQDHFPEPRAPARVIVPDGQVNPQEPVIVINPGEQAGHMTGEMMDSRRETMTGETVGEDPAAEVEEAETIPEILGIGAIEIEMFPGAAEPDLSPRKAR